MFSVVVVGSVGDSILNWICLFYGLDTATSYMHSIWLNCWSINGSCCSSPGFPVLSCVLSDQQGSIFFCLVLYGFFKWLVRRLFVVYLSGYTNCRFWIGCWVKDMQLF